MPRRGKPVPAITAGPGFPIVLALLLILAGPAGAQVSSDFPVITTLDSRDLIFKQYQDDVNLARRRIYGRDPKITPQILGESLRIYSYTLTKTDDLYRLAARCNIPYSALATLNRMGHADPVPQTILVPTIPGLFIPVIPQNDLERLMWSSRPVESGAVAITVRKTTVSEQFTSEQFTSEQFTFIPGADFTPTERTFFLNVGFRFPLQNYRITSTFGMRPSPFTGKLQNHNGLDLAAPSGTEVYAAREGVVTETGSDPVYGDYIIIAHDDAWVSLYGHLSAISTSLHAKVTRESVIGRVGSTGQSTGPHLHFELRKNGAALDPGKLLFR